jgi:hypothetical protein
MSGGTGAVDAQPATTHEAHGDGYQAVLCLSALDEHRADGGDHDG